MRHLWQFFVSICSSPSTGFLPMDGNNKRRSLFLFSCEDYASRAGVQNGSHSSKFIGYCRKKIIRIVRRLISRPLHDHFQTAKLGHAQALRGKNRSHGARQRRGGVTGNVRRLDQADTMQRALDLTLEHGFLRSTLVIHKPLLRIRVRQKRGHGAGVADGDI